MAKVLAIELRVREYGEWENADGKVMPAGVSQKLVVQVLHEGKMIECYGKLSSGGAQVTALKVEV